MRMIKMWMCLVALLLSRIAMAEDAGSFHCKVPWDSSEAPCLDTEIQIPPGQTVTLTVKAIKKENGTPAMDSRATIFLIRKDSGNPLSTMSIGKGTSDSWSNNSKATITAVLRANVAVAGTRIVEGEYTVK